ncbi:MAG: hypothetical protein MUF15_18850 [Acidobacteria bacterium]|nr:hypothetical protein [Acidobacteriota bacterium]
MKLKTKIQKFWTAAFIFITMILTLVMPGLGEDWFKVNGYYKFFFIGIKLPNYKVEAQDNQSFNVLIGAASNRFRLKLSAKPLNWLSLEAAYDFAPRIQDPTLFKESVFITPSSPYTYRLEDFNPRIYPKAGIEPGSFAIFHNLDRLVITIKTGIADINIGRQPIAWGSGRLFNPTDIVAPFAFNELDKEERVGVDAVRIRIPLGQMDELDIGYIFGRHLEAKLSAYYLRGKTYILKTDISGLVMRFRENLLFGLDLARSIGGAGSWFEAAYVLPYHFANSDDIDNIPKNYREKYFRASIGMDYNFSSRFYGFLEYHFNSAGKRKPLDYNNLFHTVAYQEGSVYLMGKHYFDLGLTYQVSPLLPFNGVVIINAGDGSIILSPNLEYNIAENIYLSFGAYLGIGKRPALINIIPNTKITQYHSEFGSYPNLLYTSFRIYF